MTLLTQRVAALIALNVLLFGCAMVLNRIAPGTELLAYLVVALAAGGFWLYTSRR